MEIKKPDKRPLAQGKGEPVITIISETERILDYPDGLTIHETKNRPLTTEDSRWLIAMVADLVPLFQASSSDNKQQNALNTQNSPAA